MNGLVKWRALVLAAGRGPSDPLAAAYGVSHKCTIKIAGEPMLKHVMRALRDSGVVERISVSIDDRVQAAIALSDEGALVHFFDSASSAPASALEAASVMKLPVLITTGDHPLLTPQMVAHFCAHAAGDFSVGLATAETVMGKYPNTRRTFFKFGATRVSGCNIFSVNSEAGIRVLERWQHLDQQRKKPWRLVASFGIGPLFRFAIGRLSLERAFAIASEKIGADVHPVLMPFAEAAIDVDKPEDKELAERIMMGD
jgi:GTP:adenosylcobinamide-phosphate guanylyltransferase